VKKLLMSGSGYFAWAAGQEQPIGGHNISFVDGVSMDFPARFDNFKISVAGP
jgi:hypothetical protein